LLSACPELACSELACPELVEVAEPVEGLSACPELACGELVEPVEWLSTPYKKYFRISCYYILKHSND